MKRGVSLVREWQPGDRGQIPSCYREKYPDQTFRWLNDRHRDEVGGLQNWEVVPHDPTVDRSPPGPGNTVRRGANFLGMMPKEFKTQRVAWLTEERAKRRRTIDKGTVLAQKMQGVSGIQGLGTGSGGKLTMGIKKDLNMRSTDYVDPDEIQETMEEVAKMYDKDLPSE